MGLGEKMTDLSLKIRENYEDYYKDYNERWRELGAREKVIPIIRNCRKQGIEINRVLDVGSGDGQVIEKLSKSSFAKEYYAIDISQSAVNIINNKKINGLKECKKFNGMNIPYEDKTFDLAIITHVLEHVEHTRVLLYELARVSKYVFVEVPLEDKLRLHDEFVFDKTGHINYFNRKTVRMLLQSCGYEIIEECVEDSLKEVYAFENSKKSILQYYIKKAALATSRILATLLFTYRYNALSKTK